MPETATVARSAVISADGDYRYELRRTWDPDRPPVLFVMLNPSTADEFTDDPTIRRCIGFARALGHGGLIVGNLYAYRATDPKDLGYCFDPVGPENDGYLARMTAEASRVIAAWGAWPGPDRGRPARVHRHLGDVEVLGVTKHGHPRHPLYMPAAAIPVRWAA